MQKDVQAKGRYGQNKDVAEECEREIEREREREREIQHHVE